MALGIRRAQPDDAGGISLVKIETWKSAYAEFLDPRALDALSFEQTEARFWEYAQRDDLAVFVAEHESAGIVGYVVVGQDQTGKDPGVGEIHAIYVLSQWQGKRIGILLLREGTEWLIERGFSSIQVWCFKQNQRAVDYYVSLGARYMRSSTFKIAEVECEDSCFRWDLANDLLSNLDSRFESERSP